jgi:phosphinothricin acetyltransferase
MTSARPVHIARPCFQHDLEFVTLIHAHYVTTSTAALETQPLSRDEMEARWSSIVTQGWPFLVASPTSDLTRVVGFACAQPFRDREMYPGVFEDLVYAAPGSVRKGVGAILLTALLHQLKDDGARQVLALIADGAPAAIGLHAALGFREVGTLERVAFKFDRWLDVILMQRPLLEGGEPR